MTLGHDEFWAEVAQSQARGILISGGLGDLVDVDIHDNATTGLEYNTSITCANWNETNVTFLNNTTDRVCP